MNHAPPQRCKRRAVNEGRNLKDLAAEVAHGKSRVAAGDTETDVVAAAGGAVLGASGGT
jgi:hypothetical protein